MQTNFYERLLSRLPPLVGGKIPVEAAISTGVNKLRYRNTSLSNSPASIKSGSGSLYGYNAINTGSAAVYLKLYDGTPTVGTTPPIMVLLVPANGTIVLEMDNAILSFNDGLSAACVAGVADSSSTAPPAGLYCEISYA